MLKVFYDLPYYTFSPWTDIAVLCPICRKAGRVRFDREQRMAFFHCESCYAKKETVPGGNSAFEVTAQCTSTGKYFCSPIPGDKRKGQKQRVRCPYCRENVIGDVVACGKQYIVFKGIRDAQDPYFHYPLYFQAGYRGKRIWALNREHLQYLIDYLSAGIRTVPYDFYETCGTMRSQSDMLPTFMKTAKNREGIVKLLVKLRDSRAAG